MTKNSKMILDIVNSSHDHPTADQIFIRAKEQNSKVVLATVYNNLNSLVKEGKIRRIAVSGKPDCYDNTFRHDHTVCVKCGALSDIMIDDITEEIKSKLGDSFVSYDLNVSYICDECREK
ncbi:MAG: transcriptional repressor [Clostridia bacterium]|nr:transcriptional repressor [Clostridia bacterium]